MVFFFFFFAVVLVAAVFGAALALAFVFALAEVFAFLAGLAAASGFSTFSAFRRVTGAASFSATGARVWPMAVASISTASDQSRWYVETSEYGSTWTRCMFRPLR